MRLDGGSFHLPHRSTAELGLAHHAGLAIEGVAKTPHSDN
jgi:hypothetical protein